MFDKDQLCLMHTQSAAAGDGGCGIGGGGGRLMR